MSTDVVIICKPRYRLGTRDVAGSPGIDGRHAAKTEIGENEHPLIRAIILVLSAALLSVNSWRCD